MYFKLVLEKSNFNWNFVPLTSKILKVKYNWLSRKYDDSYIEENKNLLYDWAYERNLKNIFYLSTYFNNSEKLMLWNSQNDNFQFDEIQLKMIQEFCYSDVKIDFSFEELLDQSNYETLLDFILIILDRALLWHDPDPSWKSDFYFILNNCFEKKKEINFENLKWEEEDYNIKGHYFVSEEEFTGTYYKFENLIQNMNDGKIIYDVRLLAKQTLETLRNSIIKSHEFYSSNLTKKDFDLKIDTIIEKEMHWSMSKLFKMNNK
ncbi:hypothetical protein [Aureivirga sp. CE67]|uniref:hypothetical protein n=1 Tax=Aureivirga sp. CE67 TaxID=1788983 RepID=UPI0018C9F1DE|nr:hypothetical protein [Aureivirga sp. CE67]